MEKYELTIVLDAKATAVKKKKVTEVVEKIVALAKGKLGKVEDWGVKEAGLYLFFPLELEKSSVKMISTKMEQETDILKYLLIRKY
ncbi:MAG: 30S ribosomal protein S6 [Candidatus Woesebacteria bacterium]|nr:30S ribosomal protein S6 [Candidatus Woesebacteria bacterium]